MLAFLLCALSARAAPPSVFLEDLTWMETRAAIASGTTVVIVPTGGTEQGGPHLALGKHNFIVRHAAEQVAQRLKTAIVAPVIAYVPEGSVDPPSGHMRWAGTLSIPERVFESLLEHTGRSLRAHGFTLICFLGDSGENQKSQQRVAEKLNHEWRYAGARVLHVGDYYARGQQREWLKARGESAWSIGLHGGIIDTSELMFVQPEAVRRNLLKPTAPAKESGADGDPWRATAEQGEALLELRIDAALRQIKGEMARMLVQPTTRPDARSTGRAGSIQR